MRQKELKSTDWQRNLKIAWIGTFFTGASFSIVIPFMALYIEELGVKGDMVEWYAGLSVAISALASALVSPIWGRLADRYGRKPMIIRASMVMTFTMGGLAQCFLATFLENAEWFVCWLCPKCHSFNC